MTKWSVALAKEQLSKIIENCAIEPQVITNRGKPVALVIKPQQEPVTFSSETGSGLIERIDELKKRHKPAELKTMPRRKEKLTNPFESED